MKTLGKAALACAGLLAGTNISAGLDAARYMEIGHKPDEVRYFVKSDHELPLFEVTGRAGVETALAIYRIAR